MLKVSPLDKSESMYIKYSENFQKLNSDVYVLELSKDSEGIGYVVCTPNDIYLEILDLVLIDKGFSYLEFFLKSICAFAQNHNKFTLKCKNTNLF